MAEKQQRNLDGRATLTWSQLPETWRKQDNIYILRGYRPLNASYTQCLSSLFYFHNESVNIWTHLLGIPLFLLSGFYLWASVSAQYPSTSQHDIAVFGCFFAGVTTCLTLSTAFHTFSAHSKDAHDHFLLLDFMGILALIAGSWIPGIYYGFYCHSAASQICWSMICTITTICAVVIAIPYCRTPAWKPFRTSMFVTLGLSGIIPMTYAAYTFGIPQANLQMGWKYIILEGNFYLAGATMYAWRIPERWWPGRFDLVGASHQWFHGLVLMGAGAHLMGIVLAFRYNHDPFTRMCEHFWA